MRNVLVTGGTGFIGRALCQRLAEDAEVRVVAMGSRTVDLVDGPATFRWFERMQREFPCDYIFHLAALYKAGDWPVRHPATQFYVNAAINVNLLEAWARFYPGAKLVTVLSYCMYPSHEDPHPESELWGTEPEDYLFAYAMAKKALLVGQRAYRRQSGLRSTSVVLPTVYGPHDSFAEDSHVIGALVGKFVRAARAEADVIEVWGDGKQEREFLYVDDAVDGLIAAALNATVEVLNLGGGQGHAIRDVVSLIRTASGFRGRVEYNTNRFTGVKKRVLDVSLLRKHLGWSPSASLEIGIERTVRWFEAYLDAR